MGHYCNTFTTNRPAMASLYVSVFLLLNCVSTPLTSAKRAYCVSCCAHQQAESTLTWEGTLLPPGPASIMEKLNVGSCDT